MGDDAPPLLDAFGLLAPGVHDVTLEQVERLFGGFQRSDRRMRLFARLREYVEELRRTEWDVSLIIDGSFVMGCVDEPEDIDLVLVMPAGWDEAAELRPFEYNVVSRRRVHRRFKFDIAVVVAGTPDELHWLEFFAQTNPKWIDELSLPLPDVKGLLRIHP